MVRFMSISNHWMSSTECFVVRRSNFNSNSAIPTGKRLTTVMHIATWFMQNFSESDQLVPIRDQEKVYSPPGNGKIPFVSTEDIARVALRLLLDEKPHNTDYVILGPELLSHDDVSCSFFYLMHWHAGYTSLSTIYHIVKYGENSCYHNHKTKIRDPDLIKGRKAAETFLTPSSFTNNHPLPQGRPNPHRRPQQAHRTHQTISRRNDRLDGRQWHVARIRTIPRARSRPSWEFWRRGEIEHYRQGSDGEGSGWF